MRALSNQSDPRLASRPFDVRRDGFVGAGGAVAHVLEEAAGAAQRGARARAVAAGWGQASDGFRIAASHPEGAGLRLAMERALAYMALEPNKAIADIRQGRNADSATAENQYDAL